ncbi:uncharacterized protein BDZ99DRAFT_576470 [Mytilinidion resinicola]|uniref:PD-(D/E)XK nuclease-like domain-containing protein n=1 Tax=Mytilinidion resinicola TaxID=574789 RepID=A0A6A6Y2I7_9PEZI|nr:uncharacterized protein BDZ99DRAFT_576470 [Mytilinidion resinicola]KAF2802870.1 hypothetical protein BDZ99DRAFT_576470 [Mytilinidion resinicola]
MHAVTIAAWVRELESPAHSRLSPPPLPTRKRARPNSRESPHLRKTRRLVLAEMAANDYRKSVSSSHKNKHSGTFKTTEKKRIRTPSPQKRQFPADAYSPDEDSLDELDGPTPRPRNQHHTHPIPKLSYSESLAAIAVGFDGNDDTLQARSPLRSQSQSASSARSASPKKVTSLWDVGNGVIYTNLANTAASRRLQLGTVGLALLEALEDVCDGPVFAARLKAQLAEAGIERIRPHMLDQSDNRPMEELLCELRTVQTINALSHRCAENRDHESEWNNRVHTKVLELALGNNEVSVGFRSVTAARITSEFRPTHSPSLTTGKIVDYAMFLELSGPARDAILSLIGMSSESINHATYEGLRIRPIAVSIETKTESRTVEEAKVQLGVWVAAQVARIEALIQQVAVLKANKHGAEREARSETSRRGRQKSRGKGGKISQSQPTPTPTIDAVSPDPTDLLSQIVFPLLDVQSESWSLFFGRVSISPDTSSLHIRKPASHIQIFHSIALGNTANTAQTYRLVKSLKVLRAWIDGDFRKWWDRLLGVNGVEFKERSN